QVVDYEPPSDTLLAGQVRLYRRTLAAGERLSARVAPASGDADLYVWGPDGSSLLVSNAAGTAVDEGTVTAPSAGVYQVEVYAYTDTTYRLTLSSGPGASAASAGGPGLLELAWRLLGAGRAEAAKPVRTAPVVAASDQPAGKLALPPLPSGPAPTPLPAPVGPAPGGGSSGGGNGAAGTGGGGGGGGGVSGGGGG